MRGFILVRDKNKKAINYDSCNVCMQTIKPGENYRSYAYMINGAYRKEKHCKICQTG